jgi:lipoprotein signal peptidase
MAKVNGAWISYLTCWAVFAIGGVALRFIPSNEIARGVGTALIFFGGVGFMIDGFAERRAVAYVDALKTMQATPSQGAATN